MLRTGQQYREALRDGRRVWLGGEWVADVTAHPALQGAIQSIAELYEAQHLPENRDLLTMPHPGYEGRRVSRAYLWPTSRDELASRREVSQWVARRTGGLLGRPPEYMAFMLLGLLNVREQLTRLRPELRESIEWYAAYCRDNDLCLSSAFADPQIDRSKPEAAESVRVVRQTDAGIVVSGVKTVATLAPQCDELVVLTSPRAALSPDQAVHFAVPIASEGLTLICRDSCSDPRLQADRPAGARFEEMDAWAIFDNVHVPWERVFMLGDVEAARRLFGALLAWPHYHILVRQAVKGELFAGLCYLIADALQTRQIPQVQAAIAEVVRYAETLKACFQAAEEGGERTPAGYYLPAHLPVAVGLAHAMELYPRMLSIIREMSGQSILTAPGQLALRDESVGPVIRRYFRGGNLDPDDKSRLFKLAWDVACDSFAGREALFESFNAGGLYRVIGSIASGFDRGEAVAMAARLAGLRSAGALAL